MKLRGDEIYCGWCGEELDFNKMEPPIGEDPETGEILPGAKFNHNDGEFQAVSWCPSCSTEIFPETGEVPDNDADPFHRVRG